MAGPTLAVLRTYLQDNGVQGGNDTEALRSIDRIINEAVRRLANSHLDHYRSMARVDLVAPYSTGTVAIANGSKNVTLAGAGAAFPSWAASGRIIFTSDPEWDHEYEVATRTGDTAIILDSNFQGTTQTADTYSIFQMDYAMPTDFNVAILDELDPVVAARYLTPNEFELKFSKWIPGVSGDPEFFTIENKLLRLMPYPDAADVFKIPYYRMPADMDEDEDTADIDTGMENLLYRAIDFHLEMWRRNRQRDNDVGGALALYKEAKSDYLASHDRHVAPARWGRGARSLSYNPFAGTVTDE